MIIAGIYDTPRVREYLESIAEGFYKNPVEIIGSIAGVAALLGVLVFLALWWKRKEDQQRQEKSDAAFDSIAERLNLTFSEIDLMKRLSVHGSGGRYSLPAIAKSQQAFNSVVKKVLKNGSAREDEIAALRYRLGHTRNNARGILNSTVSLQPGTPVELYGGENLRLFGSVLEVTPVKFTIKLLSDDPIKGRVELRFARPTGIYSCRQQVLRCHNGIAEFRHTESIKRTQKRNSLRKKMAMSVTVNAVDETYRGTLIDLSEGGAQIVCSCRTLEEGQTVDVILFQATEDAVGVSAKIVRVEPDSGYTGLEFDSVDPKTRERIINTVFH